MPDRSAALIPYTRFTPATQRGSASDRPEGDDLVGTVRVVHPRDRRPGCGR